MDCLCNRRSTDIDPFAEYNGLITALGLSLSVWLRDHHPHVTEDLFLLWASVYMDKPEERIREAYEFFGYWRPLGERDTPTQTVTMQYLAIEHAKKQLGVGEYA